MSILGNVREAMENEGGLQDMIDAAIDVIDDDESFTDLEPTSSTPGVYGGLPTEEDREIDDSVGEEDTADIDDFLRDDGPTPDVDSCDECDDLDDCEDDPDEDLDPVSAVESLLNMPSKATLASSDPYDDFEDMAEL